MPLVNYFPKKSAGLREKRYPLTLVTCDSCGLAQVDYIVSPKDIFLHYYYVTGASQPLVDQLKELASDTLKRFTLTNKHHVLDIGSNDGTLLSNFAKRHIGVLGVEPSRYLARVADRRGVPTIKGFFTRKMAHKIVRRYGQFDLVFVTHVLANIVDIRDFFHGLNDVVASDGVCIIEVGYLGSMLEKGQFDAIYHEHYSYFSLTALARICADHGFSLIDATFPSTQGGSLRIYIKHSEAVKHPFTMHEHISKSDFAGFAKKVDVFRDEFNKIFASYKGKTIVGFGAPAKCITLLSYCNIQSGAIAYIVDSTPVKQGRVLPYIGVPVVPESHMKKKKPDVVVLLAWNYQEAILPRLKRILPRGTPVVIPFPSLKVKKT